MNDAERANDYLSSLTWLTGVPPSVYDIVRGAFMAGLQDERASAVQLAADHPELARRIFARGLPDDMRAKLIAQPLPSPSEILDDRSCSRSTPARVAFLGGEPGHPRGQE